MSVRVLHSLQRLKKGVSSCYKSGWSVTIAEIGASLFERDYYVPKAVGKATSMLFI
jgi:hypothetical protein